MHCGQSVVSTVSKETPASLIVIWWVCCVRDAADTFAGDCPRTDNSLVTAAEKSALTLTEAEADTKDKVVAALGKAWRGSAAKPRRTI